MKRRWVVQYGPEYPESKRACRASPGRLKLHLAAIELNLERDPFGYSEPFEDESHRVIETTDYFNDGFVLTAFVRLCEGFIAQIMWVDMRPLPDDGEEDED